MLQKIALAVLALCVYSNIGFSANQGTSGAQFLKIITTPRPAALGGAFTAIDGDMNSIVFNPAGMSTIEKKDVVFVQNNWIQDITNQFAAFGMHIKGFGTLGLAVDMVNVNDIAKIDNTATTQGTYSATDMAATLGYAASLGDGVGIGLNAKYISSKIADQTASAMAADVGALYKASSKLNIGLAVQNMGTDIKFIDVADPLPLTIKLGGALRVGEQLLLALDLSKPNDTDLYAAFGAEFTIPSGQKLLFPVRAGYRTGLQTGGLSGLGTGIGILYDKAFGLDLAWNPDGDLGDSMKFGLRFVF